MSTWPKILLPASPVLEDTRAERQEQASPKLNLFVFGPFGPVVREFLEGESVRSVPAEIRGRAFLSRYKVPFVAVPFRDILAFGSSDYEQDLSRQFQAQRYREHPGDLFHPPYPAGTEGHVAGELLQFDDCEYLEALDVLKCTGSAYSRVLVRCIAPWGIDYAWTYVLPQSVALPCCWLNEKQEEDPWPAKGFTPRKGNVSALMTRHDELYLSTMTAEWFELFLHGQLPEESLTASYGNNGRARRRPGGTGIQDTVRVSMNYAYRIDRLDFLQQCPLLQELTLKECVSVQDLSPLAHCQNLRCIDLSGCDSVSSLRPLFDLPQLRLLRLNVCLSLSLGEVTAFIKDRPNCKVIASARTWRQWACNDAFRIPALGWCDRCGSRPECPRHTEATVRLP